MKLPVAFLNRMKSQLGDEFDAFIESYNRETIKGIRVNTLKISVEDFLKITDFDLIEVPWTRNGFYVNHEELGKHPHYFAGLYYIQEPSAMLPAELADPKPGSIVLDLCAAPGGKSMQLAAMIEDEGLLISNDISSKRLRALVRNAELMGLKNIIVLNETQENIAKILHHTVDTLVIDAPCSGEGMFKKDDDATSAYETYDVENCTEMQRGILDIIPEVLKENGEMVYSTCTFNEFENEEMIRYVQKLYPLDVVHHPFSMFETGIHMPDAIRVYPHKIKGEGHFAAKLKNQSNLTELLEEEAYNEPPEDLKVFMDTYLNKPIKGYFHVAKEHVFLKPRYKLPQNNLKMIKEGWYLGEMKKNRFTPSHAFALGLKASEFKQIIELDRKSTDVEKYLKCETLYCEGKPGFNLICVDGYPIGWGKWSNGKLKNLYPAAWRLQ
ncbi:MAG: RsmB/NOP family class I SAM-dependent RNA methyltransferase [Clostridia bacterium]|nr:RsmB/NOP family class I SAM-dependent RNA methyltransferase [Clostridia bacterium]